MKSNRRRVAQEIIHETATKKHTKHKRRNDFLYASCAFLWLNLPVNKCGMA